MNRCWIFFFGKKRPSHIDTYNYEAWHANFYEHNTINNDSNNI